MKVVRTVADLRDVLAPARRGLLTDGAPGLQTRGRIGFVPTMGALHEGHVTLVRAARRDCAQVVVSVFVNPMQFNDAADLAAYPRNDARDAEIAAASGADVLFMPDASEVYPAGHATSVDVRGAALGYEGDHRPGHFSGVATVCLSLFNIVRPDVVYFGQKDAQQVAVIQQVVRDVHLDLRVSVVPTVRDVDGLALSSRNVRLSPDERLRARAIPGALRAGLAAHRAGGEPVAAARAALGGLDIQYVSVAPFDAGATLVVAVKAGAIRLIDNVPLDHPDRAGL
jgi:pantoate--beta-alanine ligase